MSRESSSLCKGILGRLAIVPTQATGKDVYSWIHQEYIPPPTWVLFIYAPTRHTPHQTKLWVGTDELCVLIIRKPAATRIVTSPLSIPNIQRTCKQNRFCSNPANSHDATPPYPRLGKSHHHLFCMRIGWTYVALSSFSNTKYNMIPPTQSTTNHPLSPQSSHTSLEGCSAGRGNGCCKFLLCDIRNGMSYPHSFHAQSSPQRTPRKSGGFQEVHLQVCETDTNASF